MPPLLTTQEVCAILKCDRKFVEALVRRKKLRCTELAPRMKRYRREDVEKLLTNSQV